MSEEGEGELHPRVEEQVEEVRRADLLQLGQLRGRHRAGEAREPEQLHGVDVLERLLEGGGGARVPPARGQGLREEEGEVEDVEDGEGEREHGGVDVPVRRLLLLAPHREGGS